MASREVGEEDRHQEWAASFEQRDAHGQVLGNSVERHAGEQREADSGACGRSSRRRPFQPGVDEDEGGGTGREGRAGPPCVLAERVLEELEGNGSHEGARREPEQGRRHSARRCTPDADERPVGQRAGRVHAV